MSVEKVYISEGLLALREELNNHPALKLSLESSYGTEQQLGEIAAYCGVVLDGYYSIADIGEIVIRLTQKLKDKNALVILGEK